MFIDRNILEEYPFTGQFYTSNDNMPDNGDVLEMLDETKHKEVEETIILETKCDIQGANKAFSADTSGSYIDIYFPFDVCKGIEVRIGHRFKSLDWYRPIDGRVYTVIPTQMGGCVAQIKEVGVDNDEL